MKSNKVIAQIATIPPRMILLKLVVHSLLPQVDKINIMLNGHRQVPTFLNHPKIDYFLMDNSKGDASKFFGLRGLKGYIFTCDDDLVYPTDYVSTMVAKLQKYDNKVILTNHGRIMKRKPVTNAYTDRLYAYHCLKEVTHETDIDIGGSGVMAWHSDYFFPDYDLITSKNMGDIWIAKFAKDQGCKIVINPHRAGWIKYLNPDTTIWDEAFENPKEMTDLYNSI